MKTKDNLMTTRCLMFYLSCLLLLYACNTPKKTAGPIILPTASDTEIKSPVKQTPLPIDPNLILMALKNRELQVKYGARLQVSPDSISIKLYSFIDEWIGTPYKWGGTDKHGIDCSAFTQRLFSDVYDLQMPRTAIEQACTNRIERFPDIRYLAEGDMLFFRTVEGTVVSHVGFYLRNNKFICASTKKGVDICDLFDSYWRACFVTAGRVKVPAAEKSSYNTSMR